MPFNNRQGLARGNGSSRRRAARGPSRRARGGASQGPSPYGSPPGHDLYAGMKNPPSTYGTTHHQKFVAGQPPSTYSTFSPQRGPSAQGGPFWWDFLQRRQQPSPWGVPTQWHLENVNPGPWRTGGKIQRDGGEIAPLSEHTSRRAQGGPVGHNQYPETLIF